MLFLTISFTIVIIIYFIISLYFFQHKRNIKNKRNWTFAEGRNKCFVAVEVLFIAIFLVVCFVSMNFANQINLSPFLVSGLLLLMSINQGMEEWIYYRKDKVYYHRLLQCAAFLTLIFLSVIDRGVF